MNRDLKIAILEKVTDILDNIDCPETFSVNITYYRDEAPSISYNVKELVGYTNGESRSWDIEN